MSLITSCLPDHIQQHLYSQICNELGIDQKLDISHVLTIESKLKDNYNPILIEKKLLSLSKHNVLILGAAKSLGHDFSQFIKIKPLGSIPIICADGATHVIRRYGSFPTVVVSDLDGIIPYKQEMHTWPTIFVIHVHGDNQRLMENFWPFFNVNNTIFTTQTVPTLHIRNYGGFTDGDRAVNLACALSCPEIGLLGFDFNQEPAAFSKSLPWTPDALARKKQKLKIAEEIINLVAEKSSSRIKFLSCQSKTFENDVCELFD